MSDPSSANRRLHSLAVSGSVRGASSNTALLQAAATLAPDLISIALYPSVADLPHFNPDLDGEGMIPPAPVADFRARLRAADGVLICSPEYAHCVPGSLKKALDWVVGSGEFMHKAVALINASATSSHAQASLSETLTIMMARVSSTRVPLKTNKIDRDAILAVPDTSRALRQVVESLAFAASTSI